MTRSHSTGMLDRRIVPCIQYSIRISCVTIEPQVTACHTGSGTSAIGAGEHSIELLRPELAGARQHVRLAGNGSFTHLTFRSRTSHKVVTATAADMSGRYRAGVRGCRRKPPPRKARPWGRLATIV